MSVPNLGKQTTNWFWVLCVGHRFSKRPWTWSPKGHPLSHPDIQAYNQRLVRHRGETTLPNLGLSPYQLFFRSYAQVGRGHPPPTTGSVSGNTLCWRVKTSPPRQRPRGALPCAALIPPSSIHMSALGPSSILLSILPPNSAASSKKNLCFQIPP